MSKKLLINIRGCNGSGKSTVPISMMNDPDMYVIEKPYKGKDRKIVTVFPTYGFVALGSYHNKCGGLDGYVDTDMVKKGMWYALKKFPEYHIIMEGVIPSTVYSTYEKLFKEVQQKYPERLVVVLNLLPSVAECIHRIKLRNGGKPIKEDLVRSKWDAVHKNSVKFRQAGIISLNWDNSGIWPKYAYKPMVKHMMDFLRKELKKDGKSKNAKVSK